MNKKRRLELMTLGGNVKPYIEIEICPNSDIYVNMLGQDVNGTSYLVSAQVPSPIRGGGGNTNTYGILKIIYDMLDPNILSFDDPEAERIFDKMSKSLTKSKIKLLDDRARTGAHIEEMRTKRSLEFFHKSAKAIKKESERVEQGRRKTKAFVILERERRAINYRSKTN